MASFQTEIVDLDVEVANARASLHADELKRASRFLRDEDRRRFVVARSRLREILGGLLGIAPERVAFAYGAYGKPALAPAQAESGLRFNLSHSADRALVAWTHDGEIGSDLERVRAVRFGAKIARRYFSDDEQEAFRGLSGPAWDAAFFRCWTRKEAFIKAVGDGLSHPLRSFTVPMTETVREQPVAAGWQVSTVDAGPGYLAAVVTEREGSRAS